jgi:AAA domain (Cdc48 subfamily)/C-terminal, D2-small domain, of ClpB protein
MTGLRPPLEDLSGGRLESKLRDLARRFFADQKVDELETWHLARVVEQCSRAISDVYRKVNLHQIMKGEVQRPPTLEDLLREDAARGPRPFRWLTRVPEDLRGVGDRCLYDMGMAGFRDYRGLSLEALGIRSYRMAAEILAILANERELRRLFERNQLRTLPIDEEVAFLRQCAARFSLYENLLENLREGDAHAPRAVGLSCAEVSADAPEAARKPPAPPPLGVEGPQPEVAPRLFRREEPRTRTLSRYERILLFADLAIEAVRGELKRQVIDQDEAVDVFCDDLLLHATGTEARGVPHSYFLVGPTGVGKNHLVESLARVLEKTWNVEIPFLVIEGPQYTYPSDINELKGATRGFIRSDETGLLADFYERASRSPVAFLVVDEVEKAHAQLQKFFLSIMDRGTTLDNRGQELNFEGTILAFTSNLGYSFRNMTTESIGYRAGPRDRHRERETVADHDLKRALSPEFLARLRTVRFRPLSRKSMEAILDLELSHILERFRSLHGLEVRLTASARRRLLELGFSEAQGARQLSAVVRRHCNVEVCRRIKKDELRGALERGGTIEYLREVRRGDRAFEAPTVERKVMELARVRLPYNRLTIDERDGEFRYESES